MAQQSKTTLKTYFNTGDTPTEAQFIDLIDSFQDASAVLAATTASFTTANQTKLNGIETAADVTDATNVAAAGAVMNTGNSTIAGVKTFSSSPIVPAPTTDLQAATKKYVDDAVTAGGGYTNEMAQDAVGTILAEADFAYDDATPTITLSTTVHASLALADTALQAANITATITNGVTDKAPSEDAVFDALAAKQDTLVSGTNIKTVNSTSLLGSGNITISGGTPAGSTGDIQFNSAGAFAANSLLDWDNTNARLGVGIAAPVYKFDFVQDTITGITTVAATEGKTAFFGQNPSAGNRSGLIVGANSGGLGFIQGRFNAAAYTIQLQPFGDNVVVGSTSGYLPTERLGVNGGLNVKGAGTTSGTNAITAANSAATQVFSVKNNGDANFNGTTNDASAVVQIDSTTKGFLPPRMTTTQKNAISTPAAGLVVYDTTTNKLCCYNGTTWNDLF